MESRPTIEPRDLKDDQFNDCVTNLVKSCFEQKRYDMTMNVSTSHSKIDDDIRRSFAGLQNLYHMGDRDRLLILDAAGKQVAAPGADTFRKNVAGNKEITKTQETGIKTLKKMYEEAVDELCKRDEKDRDPVAIDLVKQHLSEKNSFINYKVPHRAEEFYNSAMQFFGAKTTENSVTETHKQVKQKMENYGLIEKDLEVKQGTAHKYGGHENL
jgi:hypothetical protein